MEENEAEEAAGWRTKGKWEVYQGGVVLSFPQQVSALWERPVEPHFCSHDCEVWIQHLERPNPVLPCVEILEDKNKATDMLLLGCFNLSYYTLNLKQTYTQNAYLNDTEED